jgi:hypothetical protein
MNLPTSAESFADRALRGFARRARLPEVATRAVLQALKLLGLTVGLEIAQRRNSGEPLQRFVAESNFSKSLQGAQEEISAILADQLERAFLHHRTQYAPDLRFCILKIQRFLQWSDDETAHQFRVSPATIAR